MPRLHISTRLCILLTALAGSQPQWCAAEYTLTFRLFAPDLPEGADVYLTGNLPDLGNWRPDGVRMRAAGNQTWTHELKLEKQRSLEFKYTRGSWAREGADATGRPLPNFTHELKQSATIESRVDFWTTRREPEFSGKITGTVKYHRQVSAASVRPRDVIVWLPPHYESSHDRYPVLYMQDGQNIVDPMTSAFGVDWQIDETCTQLIAAGKIAPLIVVGIYNTADRSEEYLPGSRGTAYMNFVVKTVKPLVDQHYRTNPTRESTLVGGSSAGALCAFMLAWEHSEVFSKALCMSPAFKFDRPERKLSLNYVATVEQSDPPDMPVEFYIDNGGVGLEQELQPGIDLMLAALRGKGLRTDQQVHYVHSATARHSETDWAKRFPNAIQLLAAPP